VNTRKKLTTKETAALLDIVYGTLRKWRSSGKGPRFSRPGGTSRGRAEYDIADVKAWLAAEKAKASR
jgi:phage terminase Nu1 subunit (DNA packaging protein)